MQLSSVTFLLLWLIGFTLIMILDLIWIGLLMKGIYKEQIGHLLAFKDDGKLDPSLTAAITVWAVLAWGLIVFVLPRVDPANLIAASLVWGGLWGFTVYAIYDITNVATLRNWPILITIIDITWGSLLCAVTTLMLALVNAQFFT